MSTSYTLSETVTFNVTHARHLASKIATDLKRLQRFYGQPGDPWIDSYEQEAIELLRHGYLGSVTFGFRRDGAWIEPTLRYTARELASLVEDDDDPGRVRPGAIVSGAEFHSYLTYGARWYALAPADQAAFKATLPVQRRAGAEPGIQGAFVADRTYSAGGRSLGRASVKGTSS